tara:strand:+ start:2145 stop:3617 length:1473 start_codon:yes stop_codon:yes gene_type:complete
MININNKDFNKIITDLIKDIALVFPDILESNNNEDIINIIKYIEFELVIKKEYDVIKKENSNENINLTNENNTELIDKYNIACNNLLLYCLEIYPKLFFEILYKNENLFSNDIINYQQNYKNKQQEDNKEEQDDNKEEEQDNKEEEQDNKDEEQDNKEDKEYNTFFLPNIDFKVLFNDKSISEKTRDTLWNYLQLILITIVSNIETKNSFGDAAKLFEAIESEKLLSEFSNIIDNVKNMYTKVDDADISENSIFNNFKNIFDISSNLESLPDISGIESHLNTLLNGKIGKLAAEFSEDLYKELNINDLDNTNIKDVNDVYKHIFKNPSKLLNIVTKMGEKLDQKIKSGELSQREIIEESTKMFGSLTNTDISGMNGMQVFKDMIEGFANTNKNFNKSAFNNMMSKEKTRTRMRDKLNKKQEENTSTTNEEIDEEKMRNNLLDLLKGDSKDLKDLNSNLEQLMQGFNKESIKSNNKASNKPNKKIKKPKKK